MPKPHVRYDQLDQEKRAALLVDYETLRKRLVAMLDNQDEVCLSPSEAVALSKQVESLSEKLAALHVAGEASSAQRELPRVQRRLELAERRAAELERERDELLASLGR